MVRYLCLFFWLFLSYTLHGQEFKLRQFRVEDGLPSDIIKSVTQDSLGFFWIATDEGLVRFDGLRFTSYKDAFHSEYAKGFLHTQSGKLLAFGDLDLIEIRNNVDTVEFVTVKRGTRYETDTSLYYPKSLYETRNGDIWVGEPQSAVKLVGRGLKRYDLGIENRSTSFIRSFSFFESPGGDLFTVSYLGNVFHLNAVTDVWEPVDYKFPGEVSTVMTIGSVLWIAGGDGVYSCQMNDHTLQPPVKRFAMPYASGFLKIDDHTFWITTFSQYAFIVSDSGNAIHVLPYFFNDANSVYQSREGDIWLSTINGLLLLQKNIFQKITPVIKPQFIETIAEDTHDSTFYFATKVSMYNYNPRAVADKQITEVYYNKDGYFQSILQGKQGLWAANQFEVLLFRNKKVVRSWNFSKEGRFIHDLFIDSENNVWLGQANNPDAMYIDDSFEIKRCAVPLPNESSINLFREGPRGIYAAANGKNGYLFLKKHGSDRFENVSVPLTFPLHTDFNVIDVVICGGALWLASTEGLVRYDHVTTQLADLGERFTSSPVKSIEKLSDRYILFGNAFGLFRYDVTNGNYWFYDENNGLHSNTISNKGVYVDHKGQAWIGTSLGLSMADYTILLNKKSPPAHIVEAKINGQVTRFAKALTAPYGSYLSLTFSAITFPENRVSMQYRVAGRDTVWRAINNNQVNISDIPSGSYRLQVRAKKNGGYDWSDIKEVAIHINKPFWRQTWFILVSIALFIFIVWMSYLVFSYLTRKRRWELERQVTERTAELRYANEELTQRNSELDKFVYSASHDLSAPLKSLLGLISLARMDNPSTAQREYLAMMERSVDKLEQFIKDVINYSRNARQPIKREAVDLNELLKSILDDLQFSPNFSRISFQIEIQLSTLYSDETRLKIILNNLLSNAIKFHHVDDREAFIKVEAKETEAGMAISVHDNGNGIHPKYLDKIFDMFFRASENTPGSGLGLYILKETVHKLNGRIEVTSTVEQGTTFTIFLPKMS